MLLLLLLPLMPMAQASMLNVKVVVNQDTASVGAVVSLMTDGVIFTTIRTNGQGIASFNVSDGGYFIVVNKSIIYPEYILLKDVRGDENITVVRRQQVNYANAYGQVSAPTSFPNASVTAYSNGQVAKRTAVSANGLYMLSFLPEGAYELRFESPGFETKDVQAFLPTGEFTQFNAVLSPPKPPAEPQVIIVSPVQVSRFKLVEIVLTADGKPLSGKEISVVTPSGKLIAITDSEGTARVNAAEVGVYTFSYGNHSASTAVSVEEGAKANASEPPKANASVAPPAQIPQDSGQSAPPQQGAGNSILSAIAVLSISALIAAVAILVAAKLFYFDRKKKDGGAHAHHGAKRHKRE